VSTGPRAALPKVAEHDTPQRGVVPGDATSQSAGFTQCHHKQLAVVSTGIGRVVRGVTGLTQCLDREADPTAASGTGSQPEPMLAVANMLNAPMSAALKSFVGPVGIDSIYYCGAMIDLSGVLNMLSPLFTAHLPAAAAAAVPALAAPKAGLGGLVGGLADSLGGGGGVPAGLGQAASVGGLSVPQAGAMASPAIRLVATASEAAGLDSLPAAGPGGWSGGMPPIVSAVNAPRNGAAGARPESRHTVIPPMAGTPEVHEGTPGWGMKPNGRAAEDALSERERYELHTLREEMAEVAMERDAAARLIEEAIRR
jgi:hypothetical protein